MKWYKGPPPSKGWWPASIQRSRRILRWWDGKDWSVACISSYNAKQALAKAKKRAAREEQKYVEWTKRPASWPARSRT